MSDTLQYIVEKYSIDLSQPSPISIPNVGRNNLAYLFRELNFTKGAEIGVKRGEYSEVLLRADPLLRLYGVDPYQSYEAYRTISQQQQDECKALALERLAPYISSDRYRLIEKKSVEAAHLFDINSELLDYVYIDASHKFEDVVADVAAWTSVVRPGGCIAGHDFVRRKHGRSGGPNTSHHVIEAIESYTKAYQIHPWFVLGRYEKREGEIRDKERSYLWVKT